MSIDISTLLDPHERPFWKCAQCNAEFKPVPVVEPPRLKTPEEKAAFSRAWDERYERGTRKETP